jgi:gluconate 2-dehydrogenase gamma chain
MALWPAVTAAQQHAHQAVASSSSAFQVLDAATAADIEALAVQIIPSTDGPGAREAGVIHFIDRALATFASEDREAYRAGMALTNEKRRQLYPSSSSVAALTGDQQIALLRAIESSSFFELLRTHTVLGFLGNPSYGGNLDKAGWRHIGFEDRMSFSPPFGYYDAEAGGSEEKSK